MRITVILGVIAAFAALPLAASATEQLGPLHPIVEHDMLKEIYRILGEKERSGELAKLQAEAVNRAKRNIESPPPVAGITRTTQPRSFYWDPSVRATQPLYDQEGNLVVEAGKTLNPLDYVSLSKHLYFFDGRDSEQVAHAQSIIQHYKGMVKPILVAGPVAELSRQWQQQVYFDQGGSLVHKLGILHVPAIVSQDGKRLRIDELEVSTRAPQTKGGK